MFNKNKKSLEEMTLEEKVDQILLYQRRTQRWATVKAFVNILLFILLIILPLVSLVYFFDWIQNSVGLNTNQLQETWDGIKSLGENSQAVEERANELLEVLSQ